MQARACTCAYPPAQPDSELWQCHIPRRHAYAELRAAMMVLRLAHAAVFVVVVAALYVIAWVFGLVDREGRYPWEK